MEKGLAWVGSGGEGSGTVLVASDNGKKEFLSATLYVIRGISPPIYELPLRKTNAIHLGPMRI